MIKLAKRVARTKIENFLNTSNAHVMPTTAPSVPRYLPSGEIGSESIKQDLPRFRPSQVCELILVFELITPKGIKPEIASQIESLKETDKSTHSEVAVPQKQKVVHKRATISAKNSYARAILMSSNFHKPTKFAKHEIHNCTTRNTNNKIAIGWAGRRSNTKRARTCNDLQGTTVFVKVADLQHAKIIVDKLRVQSFDAKESAFRLQVSGEGNLRKLSQTVFCNTTHEIVLYGGIYENNVIHINQLQKLVSLQQNAFPALVHEMQKNRTAVCSILGRGGLMRIIRKECISSCNRCFLTFLWARHFTLVQLLARTISTF